MMPGRDSLPPLLLTAMQQKVIVPEAVADRQGFSGFMEGGSVKAGMGPKLRTAGRRSPPVQQETVSPASTEASSAKSNACLASRIKWRRKPTDSAETFRAVVSKTEVKRAALHNRDTAAARSQAVWRGRMHKIHRTFISHGYVYVQRYIISGFFLPRSFYTLYIERNSFLNYLCSFDDSVSK